MKWKVFELTTRTDAVDMISAVLGDLGVQGIEIEDNVPLTEAETKGMFIDILPELPPDDGTAKVRFYLDDADDEAAILAGLRQELEDMKSYMDLGACTLTTGETEDKDWINNWKEFFHPFTVDEFLIKPTWEDVPEKWADKRVIEMDPGTAFGTGQHETTQLCIRALKRRRGTTCLTSAPAAASWALRRCCWARSTWWARTWMRTPAWPRRKTARSTASPQKPSPSLRGM